MTDVTAIALGHKTKGAMFTSLDEMNAAMADVDARIDEVYAAIDPNSMVVGDTRTCDIDLGRVIGSVYCIGDDGHLEAAPASAIRLVILLPDNKALTVDDAYPALAESDAGVFEPVDETGAVIFSDEWRQLAKTDDAAATVAVSRVIPEVPVLTDPKDGNPAYLPLANGRYECSRLGYHAVNLTPEECQKAWELTFPLMVTLAGANGCVFDVREPGPEFDEWEHWREEATANEMAEH